MGTGAGLGARGKVVDACQRAIQKADAKLAGGTTAALRRCATQVLACRQQKPGDPTCLAKAQVACPKLRAGITRLEAKLATTIAKKCDAPLLANAELLGAAGAGFQSEAGYCKALGVPSLASTGALTDCLTRHEQCRARQLVERELPRLDELLATGGVVFPETRTAPRSRGPRRRRERVSANDRQSFLSLYCAASFLIAGAVWLVSQHTPLLLWICTTTGCARRQRRHVDVGRPSLSPGSAPSRRRYLCLSFTAVTPSGVASLSL